MNARLAAVSVLAASACASEPPTLPSATLGESSTISDTAAASEEGTGASDDSGGTSSVDGTAAGTSVDTGPTGDDDPRPPASCGNAFVDAGEMCDDGNASEIDGCTSTCEIGPIDVLPSGATNTDAVSFAAGLTAIDVDCLEGSVVVGANVFISKAAIGFQFHCAPLGLADSNPTSITMGAAMLEPVVGNAGGTEIPSVCPAGEIFGAIDLAVAGGDLVGMGVTCRGLDVEGTGADQTLVPFEAGTVPFQGGGSPNHQLECPPAMVAIGMRVSVDGADIPHGLGIRCRAMQLVYP